MPAASTHKKVSGSASQIMLTVEECGMDLAECPVKTTVDVIGGKWKTLILYFLKDGPRRYNALRRELKGASHKVLTEQLRQLEKDGIVLRQAIPGTMPSAEYSLAEYGKTLVPVLNAMADWGLAHRAKIKTGLPAGLRD
jgi:DNA-binding HxlR family transcriptional regulator